MEEHLVSTRSAPRRPAPKAAAEPPQLIVPATSTKRQRQVGQVGVLFAEQLCNQIRRDLNFNVRHRRNRSPSIENRPSVRPIGVWQAHPTSRRERVAYMGPTREVIGHASDREFAVTSIRSPTPCSVSVLSDTDQQ